MRKIPTKPEDLFFKSGKSTLDQALQFLIDTRNYVAQLKVPDEYKHYRQIAHSGDTKIVGGDKNRPAILDASYKHMGGDRLSISFPIFTPAQSPVSSVPRHAIAINWDKLRMKFNSNSNRSVKIENSHINTGLTVTNLLEAFTMMLEDYNVELDFDTQKIGFSLPEATRYVEVSVENTEIDFEKGRTIIQTFVHCNAQTPQELQQDIYNALGLSIQTPPIQIQSGQSSPVQTPPIYKL